MYATTTQISFDVLITTKNDGRTSERIVSHKGTFNSLAALRSEVVSWNGSVKEFNYSVSHKLIESSIKPL